MFVIVWSAINLTLNSRLLRVFKIQAGHISIFQALFLFIFIEQGIESMQMKICLHLVCFAAPSPSLILLA
jgi:hypothetical protein